MGGIVSKLRQNAAGIIATAAFAAAAASTSSSIAAYRVSQWASFEDMRLPKGAVEFGGAVADRIEVINLPDTGDLKKKEALGGAATWELGKGGLELTAKPGGTLPKDYVIGLAVGSLQDRDALGDKGQALYQADFFIPATDAEIPSLAVVAMEPTSKDASTTATVPNAYYRFGITLGKNIYFSCVEAQDKAASVYFQDPDLMKRLPRGRWHRFAILLDGPETIHCYVDGNEPAFSPIKDTRLKKLQVGIMLAENRRSYKAYADNLSIQLSDATSSLPRSPFAGSWGAGAPTATAMAQKPSVTPSGTPMKTLADAYAGDVQWMEPEGAWSESQKSGKPMLLLFESPDTPGSQKLHELISSNDKARAFLSNHHCAKVDVNQLQGGTLAKQYEVFRVPTVLIVAPEGQGGARKVLMEALSQDVNWEEFASKLQIR